MPIHAVYVSSTDPPLTLRWESEKGTGQVVLDNVADSTTPAKVLYPRPDQTYSAQDAKEVFDYTQAHFEAREFVLDEVGPEASPEARDEAEGKIKYFPRRY